MQSIILCSLHEDFLGSIIFCVNINGCEKTAHCEPHMFASVLGILFYVPDNFMLIGLTVSHFISMSDKVGA